MVLEEEEDQEDLDSKKRRTLSEFQLCNIGYKTKGGGERINSVTSVTNLPTSRP